MCARSVMLAVLLLWATAGRVAAVELVILHYELFGDAEPRLVTALANSVRNVRAVESNVIVLNAAGANLTGVVADAHAVGVQTVPELGTVPLISHVSGATVAANLRLPAPLTSSVPPSVILELGDGGRVGLIGVVPADLEAELAGATVTDPVEAVRQEAARLRLAGVGTVLALGRLASPEALQLARRVPQLDALVVPGGFRERDVYPQTVSREEGGALPLLEAPLVSAPGYLGMVTLTLAADGRVAGWRGRVVPLRAPGLRPAQAADPGRPAGPATANKAGFCASVADEVGETLSELDGRRESCSQRECSLGSALADALLLAAALPSASSWSEVSLAVLSAGSLTGSLPRCAVSEADLAAATAAHTSAVSLSLAGTYLRQAFEQSADGHGSPAFLQTAGVRVVYDLSRPPGNRVRQLKVLCSECLTPRYVNVKGDVLYRLVTNSRLASGGDGYQLFRTHGQFVADSRRSERDILREYLRTRSPVPPPTGGRIFFMDEHGPVSEPPELTAADEPPAALSADGAGAGADGAAAAAAAAASPPPADPTTPSNEQTDRTPTAGSTTGAPPTTTASAMFFNSALWTLSGFFMLGMMIMAFF